MSRLTRAVFGAATIVAVVVGVPLALVAMAGWPLPTKMPNWENVYWAVRQGNIPAEVVVNGLACLVWVAWAQVVWALLWTVCVNVPRLMRGRSEVSVPLAAEPVSRLASRLVSAVMLFSAVAPTATTMAAAPALASLSPAGARPPEPARAPATLLHGLADTTRAASASPAAWTVQAGDTLWDIAEQCLGDGSRVDEIVACNTYVSPSRPLRPGQVIELPDGARAPADRTAAVPIAESTPEAPVAVTPATYAVQAGDTLWGIVEDHYGAADRLSVLAVADANGLIDPSSVFPGQSLVLPDLAPPNPPAQAVATGTAAHTVQAGDTLWGIVEDHYGSADADLVWTVATTNRLENPSVILPGQPLLLPSLEPSVGAVPEAVMPEIGVVDATATQASEAGKPDDIAAVDVMASEVVAAPVAEPTPPANADLVSVPADAEAPEGADAALRPINEWTTQAAAVSSSAASADLTAVQKAASPDEASEIVTLPRAAMLASGALMLLGVRRRRQWRAAPRRPLPVGRTAVADDATIAPPPSAATERALRAIADDERFARVDLAVRAACLSLINHRQRVHAVLAEADGAIELIATGHVALAPPWVGVAERWRLGPEVPIEALASEARRVAAPTPALVQIGVAGDTHVYVDLEALGALQIDGGPAADAIVAAVAATLATSVLAEVSPLVGVGVPVEAFCGHRLFTEADDAPTALAIAAQAVGSAAQPDTSPFELRARATGGETWEPAVVLVGSDAGEIDLVTPVPRVAVVSAAPILGPSSVLAPDGDAWELRPLGLRLTPVGLLPAEVEAIAELLEVPPIEASEPPLVVVDADDTVVDDEPLGDVGLAHSLLVRLIGPVRVESNDGRPVDFERSKTRELVAWLATHRERSTRTLARTALWELDVRDATFANVVSEARRAMARLVEPPEGDEWVGRTMTEDLPLHPLVRTDAEVIEHALAVARGRSARQASRVLRPAVELLSGMPFEGTQYLWPDPEGITSRLVLLATSAAAELAGQYLALGDVEGLFWATDRGLRVLPGHEELIGLRMQAHARVGDHAGIRLEWESYHRTLMLDPWSDGEPSPKLVALRAQLLGNAA